MQIVRDQNIINEQMEQLIKNLSKHKEKGFDYKQKINKNNENNNIYKKNQYKFRIIKNNTDNENQLWRIFLQSELECKINIDNTNTVLLYNDDIYYLCRDLNHKITGANNHEIQDYVKNYFVENNSHLLFEINNNKYLKICQLNQDQSQIIAEILEIIREMKTVKKEYKEKLPKKSHENSSIGTYNSVIENTINILKHFKQLIFTGPPGTSKTYLAQQLAISYIDENEELDEKDLIDIRYKELLEQEQINLVQFHPSYNYEDFVRGISVSTTNYNKIKYETVDKVFARMCEKANHDYNNRYVLIIDEINRANLSAVFGELIYALEYRGKEVDTPYSINGNNNLCIPKNLYIIGTMNTADRSIGHIDYAVRRRFAFVPVLPDSNILLKEGEFLFNSVQNLFKYDKNNSVSLSFDFHPDDVQPGHTYFMVTDKLEEDIQNKEQLHRALAIKFAYQVYPLLREYYKDGVLVKNDYNSGLNIKLGNETINIVSLETPENIIRKVEEVLKTFNKFR